MARAEELRSLISRMRAPSVAATLAVMRGCMLVLFGVVAAIALLGAFTHALGTAQHPTALALIAAVAVAAALAQESPLSSFVQRSGTFFVLMLALGLLSGAVWASSDTALANASQTIFAIILVMGGVFFAWRTVMVSSVLTLIMSAIVLSHTGVSVGTLAFKFTAWSLEAVFVALMARGSSLLQRDQDTQVLSRSAFDTEVQRLMTSATQDGGSVAAVALAFDDLPHQIDGVRGVTAERALRVTAETWERQLEGRGVLGRLGPHSFGLAVGGRSTAEVADIADELLTMIPFGITASAGIAAWTQQDTVGTLTGRADVALHEATSAGGNLAIVYGDPGRSASELEHGIERGEFFLEYQPIVVSATGAPYALEALVRWHHPIKGRVPPLQFIGQAERTGAIHKLGAWVAEEAMRGLAWLANEGSPLRVGINASIPELLDPAFPAVIEDTITRTGIDPRMLTIEVTEETFDRDSSAVAATLTQLRALGAQIAIDDFGSGYSSLRWLDSYPVDTVKIDQNFVRAIAHSSQRAPVLEGMIRIAHDLGLTVVVEGVETTAQVNMLRRVAASFGNERFLFQGYYFGRPAPLETHLPHPRE